MNTSSPLIDRNQWIRSLQLDIEHATGNQQSFSLLMINIRYLRDLNATFGFSTIDQLLAAIDERIRAFLREGDELQRTSSDEFALTIRSVKNPSQAILAAEKIHRELKLPFVIDGHSIIIKMVIGIASFPDHGSTVSALVKALDLAVTHARNDYLPYVIYQPHFETYTGDYFALEHDLKEAIEMSALELYFQPKMEIATGRIVGAEALSRWTHPKKGIISPDIFIDIAEKSNLISALTRWSLQSAVYHCAECAKRSKDYSLAVNFSADVLSDADIVDYVSRTLRIWDLDPGRLTLEITETAVMKNAAEGLSRLHEIRKLGVNLSIDDFGTGYSSMSYLKDLPVNELKIDKSFVMQMDEKDEDEKIVKAVVALAKSFGLKIVAEGVEKESVLKRLQEMECDIAQGYYISRPLSQPDFVTWLNGKAT